MCCLRLWVPWIYVTWKENQYDKLQDLITYMIWSKFLFLFGSSFYVQIDPTAAGSLYDREFIVCSLDLLSGLAEGLGAGIESLVSSSFQIWSLVFFQLHSRRIHTTFMATCLRSSTRLYYIRGLAMGWPHVHVLFWWALKPKWPGF